MAFKPGNKLAKGGPRYGSGRKTEDFHSALDKGLSDGKVLQTVLDMAKGQNGLWSEKVRLSAAMWLLEMKNGKAQQAVEHTGSIATTWNIVIEGVK